MKIGIKAKPTAFLIQVFEHCRVYHHPNQFSMEIGAVVVGDKVCIASPQRIDSVVAGVCISETRYHVLDKGQTTLKYEL